MQLIFVWPCVATLLGFLCCIQLHPGRKGRQQEDTGITLAKNLHLSSGFFWFNFAWLQWGCTLVQLICTVQSQTGCFLGLSSPHPTLFLWTERCGRFRLWEALTRHHAQARGSEKADLEQWLWGKTFLSVVDLLYENCCTWADHCPTSKVFSPVISCYIGIKFSKIKFSSSHTYLPVQSIFTKKQQRCPSDFRSLVFCSLGFWVKEEIVMLSVARKISAFFM